MEILLIITVLIVLFGYLESSTHRRKIKKVPIRIHINGTRGKSSVTRLVSAGLRGGGMRVLGKTTGTAASIIYPDGSEATISRRGNANIIEQLDVFNEAVENEAEAVVVECMAIRPDLQRICEERIVNSTISVISNVRADHLDVMGPRLTDAARALCGTMSSAGSKCFTAETNDTMLSIMKECAQNKKIKLIRSDSSVVTDEAMKNFSYLEHKENVALALAVCRELNVDDNRAFKGMYSATPDAGALRSHRFVANGKRHEFINAFAANDPVSTLNIWTRMSRGFRTNQTKIILLNTRKERLQRSQHLAEFISQHIECDYVFLVGEDQRVICNRLYKHLSGPCKVVVCGQRTVRSVYREMVKISPHGSAIFGIGNIGGAGRDYVDFFRRIEEKRAKRGLD